ncbi:DUF475 domain-containing protein [Sanguibacter suaedae]|uniref:DUF475 domain-containing protein n=1 Tax=Sanguibacter suaedae TaxID=2795737 RepID=A0A934ID46_9MICO|nr:DUF475 domain-containing protein [Sanguibacter suaedae]MBI9115778.1 DUF475 domain-containing protein [Sanguibacter suaedae]
MILRTFGWSFAVTIASLVAAFVYGSWNAFFLCLILGILEVSLSFDNAVVNAKILERMSAFWQKLFLTVGILIAVFGMRLVFPLVIVSVTADLGPIEALQLAMEKGDPHVEGTYGYVLNEAHPQIAAFGGMFLLMLFLDFVFEEREISWLGWLERPLARAGKLENVSVVVGAVLLLLAAELLAEDPHVVLLSGVLGMVTYLAVNGLGTLFESSGIGEESVSEKVVDNALDTESTGGGPSELAKATGKAGFFLFLYLEVLDASFSFDGVIGAFAITSDPVIIALGLGFIGAMFVRSITIYLVRKGTLAEYVFLEHGAHWAIGALAVILLVSIQVHVNEIVTGLVGVVFIGAAFLSSLRYRRLHGTEEPTTSEPATVDA